MKIEGQIIFTEYTVVAKGQHFMTVVFSPIGKARVPLAKIFRLADKSFVVRDFSGLVIGKGSDLEKLKKYFVNCSEELYERYKPV